MFGFDLGIITGVVPYIEHQFSLSGFSLGLVVAVFELGAMTGALVTGRVADKYGRKKTMIVCAVLLSVYCIRSGICWRGHYSGLMAFRTRSVCRSRFSFISHVYC